MSLPDVKFGTPLGLISEQNSLMSGKQQLVAWDRSMLVGDEAEGMGDRSALILARIAETIGCPVSTFTASSGHAPDETTELLRLWLMLEHEQDRAKVLAFLRNAVSVEPPREAAE